MVHGYRGREEGVAGKKMLAPTPPIEHRRSLAFSLFPLPQSLPSHFLPTPPPSFVFSFETESL